MAIICYIYCLAFLASHRIHRTFVRISNTVGTTNRKILIGAKLRTFCKTFDCEKIISNRTLRYGFITYGLSIGMFNNVTFSIIGCWHYNWFIIRWGIKFSCSNKNSCSLIVDLYSKIIVVVDALLLDLHVYKININKMESKLLLTRNSNRIRIYKMLFTNLQ